MLLDADAEAEAEVVPVWARGDRLRCASNTLSSACRPGGRRADNGTDAEEEEDAVDAVSGRFDDAERLRVRWSVVESGRSVKDWGRDSVGVK